jgi:hypothetical protein
VPGQEVCLYRDAQPMQPPARFHAAMIRYRHKLV